MCDAKPRACFLHALCRPVPVQNAGLLGGTKESAGPHSRSSSLASWGEWELHRLVAHFMAARFPILLALNKVWAGSPLQHLEGVGSRTRSAAKPHTPVRQRVS